MQNLAADDQLAWQWGSAPMLDMMTRLVGYDPLNRHHGKISKSGFPGQDGHEEKPVCQTVNLGSLTRSKRNVGDVPRKPSAIGVLSYRHAMRG